MANKIRLEKSLPFFSRLFLLSCLFATIFYVNGTKSSINQQPGWKTLY
jgi:hypothetical protein